PVRLRDDRHLIAGMFQQSRDDRHPKRRVIHIRVPGNVHKISLFPASLLHLFFICRQKTGCLFHIVITSCPFFLSLIPAVPLLSTGDTLPAPGFHRDAGCPSKSFSGRGPSGPLPGPSASPDESVLRRP